MLPPESIRFFQVDPLWVDCLLDGAFSIGRVMNSDSKIDQKLGEIQPKCLDCLTGFLLRSDLVSGWPDLHIEHTPENCSLVRKDYLSSHILFCLFSGKIESITIQHKPEGLFFGVEDDGNNNYRKQQRNAEGYNNGNYVNISWQDANNRVINFQSLSNSLNANNSAEFAMQMIEGVGKRTFEN